MEKETFDSAAFDEATAESLQTSDEESTETSNATSDEESNETDGGDATVETQKEEIDYKVKFSESSKEALRIREENKRIQSEHAEERAKREQLEKDLEEHRRILQESNPEAYNFKNLEKSVKSLQEQTALQREESMLKDFLGKTPEALIVKEALRTLGRANPARSYEDLWKEAYEPILTTKKATQAANLQRKQQTMPETGKGNSASDLSTSLDPGSPAFNKLPLEKRKEILKRKGF